MIDLRRALLAIWWLISTAGAMAFAVEALWQHTLLPTWPQSAAFALLVGLLTGLWIPGGILALQESAEASTDYMVRRAEAPK